MPIQIQKLDLHAPAVQLIADIWAIHQTGTGKLNLLNVVNSFGQSLDAGDLQTIKDRGDLIFTKTNSQGGTFLNQGNAVAITRGQVRVEIPQVIKGQYTATKDEVMLMFAPGGRIKGKYSVAKVTLMSARLDQKVAFIDNQLNIPIADLDVNIIHAL